MRTENLATSPESISKKQQLSWACTKEVVALATVAKKETMADRYSTDCSRKREAALPAPHPVLRSRFANLKL